MSSTAYRMLTGTRNAPGCVAGTRSRRHDDRSEVFGIDDALLARDDAGVVTGAYLPLSRGGQMS